MARQKKKTSKPAAKKRSSIAKGAAKIFADTAGITTIRKSLKAEETRREDDLRKYVKKPSRNLDAALKKYGEKSETVNSSQNLSRHTLGDQSVVADDHPGRSARKGRHSLRQASSSSGAELTASGNSSSNAKRLKSVLGWSAWIIASFFIAQVIVAIPLIIMETAGAIDVGNLSTFAQMMVSGATYAAMFVVALGGPWLMRRRIKLPKWRELLGLGRRPQWRDIGYGLSFVPIYYILLYAAMAVVVVLLTVMSGPDTAKDIVNQTQDIGFETAGNSGLQLIIIFVALVIVPPVCEELMMRGLLFGRLRKNLSFWPTAIIVSAIFALAHGQINVAIDTFILSMLMSWVREKTGTVWGPIVMHVIKNGVAFVGLFILQWSM